MGQVSEHDVHSALDMTCSPFSLAAHIQHQLVFRAISNFLGRNLKSSELQSYPHFTKNFSGQRLIADCTGKRHRSDHRRH